MGKVTRIDVRCCSGSVVPSRARGSTVYATVLFASVDDATHALSLNGNSLLGKKIVVRSWQRGSIVVITHCCTAPLVGRRQFSQLARGQTRHQTEDRSCLWCRGDKIQVCQGLLIRIAGC